MGRKKMTLILRIYIRVPVLSGRKYGLSGLVTYESIVAIIAFTLKSLTYLQGGGLWRLLA